MRKKYFTPILLTLLGVMVATELLSNRGGAPAGRSGAPGELTCATNLCHDGVLNSGNGILTIMSNAPGGQYTPGNTYTITVILEQNAISRFGFQVLAALGASGSEGTATITDAANTQKLTVGNNQYVTHTNAGTSGSNMKSWSFDWTAPGSGVGDVTFYVTGNAANDNTNSQGDLIYSKSLKLNQLSVGVDAASFGGRQLSVFPSLVRDRVTILLENAGTKAFESRIIDGQGRVVISEEIVPIGSEVRNSVDVSALAPGIYYVQLAGSEVGENARFVKF